MSVSASNGSSWKFRIRDDALQHRGGQLVGRHPCLNALTAEGDVTWLRRLHPCSQAMGMTRQQMDGQRADRNESVLDTNGTIES